MESLKKESRYEVEPFGQPVLTDVYVNENGVIKFAYDEKDDSWWTPEESTQISFFISEADAINHSRSFFPSNMEKVKLYLEHLYFNDEDKLEEILPRAVWDKYKDERYYFTYNEKEILLNALRGNLNINANTFHISEISHIEHIITNNKRYYRIILKNGKKVDTQSSIENTIIRSLFGNNDSNKSYKI